MTKVFSALNEFNLFGLSELYSDWSSLQGWEKFAVLRAIFLMRNNQRSYQLLELHETELKELGLYDLLKLGLEQEILIHYQNSFAAAISSASSLEKHPYLQGEFHFTVGISLLRQKRARMAIPFYERSLQEYATAGMDALMWRSHFNLALCFLSLKMEGDFERKNILIENHFQALNQNAQRNLMSLYIWKLVHQRRHGEVIKVVRQSLLRWKNNITLKNRVAWEGQLIYCQLKKGEPPQLDPLLRAEERSIFVQEMLRIENSSAPKDMEQIKAQLNFWKSSVEEISILNLADLTLQKILQEKRFHLLNAAARFLRQEVPSFTLMPEDLRKYSLISCFVLDRQSSFKGLLWELRQSLPSWAMKPVMNELRVIKSEHQLIAIRLDLGQTHLHVGRRSINLSQRPKILEFFQHFFSSKRGVSLQNLAVLLYPHVNEVDGLFRIRTLLHRARELIKGFDFLLLEKEMLSLSPKFQAKIVSQKAYQKKKKRIGEIIFALKQAKTPLSISEISNIVHFNRRTLQLDLNRLVAAGKLKRHGHRRSVRYEI